MAVTEKHPLQPFLPQNARILMLGSFPPPQAKWSMHFFYPNWINDMWRVMGLLFFDNRHHFEIKGEKQFDKKAVVEFCNQQGIALYDTACEVVRQKGNASDKFLEIVTPTNIPALLEQIPHCTAIVTTGEKASDVIASSFDCEIPKVGSMTIARINGKEYNFWRMPSTSRAYPLSLEKKACYYRQMLHAEIGAQ
jgi:G:T/U-mismatch repair DNA glycosylase